MGLKTPSLKELGIKFIILTSDLKDYCYHGRLIGLEIDCIIEGCKSHDAGMQLHRCINPVYRYRLALFSNNGR